jgi:hypothetical protein
LLLLRSPAPLSLSLSLSLFPSLSLSLSPSLALKCGRFIQFMTHGLKNQDKSYWKHRGTTRNSEAEMLICISFRKLNYMWGSVYVVFGITPVNPSKAASLNLTGMELQGTAIKSPYIQSHLCLPTKDAKSEPLQTASGTQAEIQRQVESKSGIELLWYHMGTP